LFSLFLTIKNGLMDFLNAASGRSLAQMKIAKDDKGGDHECPNACYSPIFFRCIIENLSNLVLPGDL
jgi:hypothetical protein